MQNSAFLTLIVLCVLQGFPRIFQMSFSLYIIINKIAGAITKRHMKNKLYCEEKNIDLNNCQSLLIIYYFGHSSRDKF